MNRVENLRVNVLQDAKHSEAVEETPTISYKQSSECCLFWGPLAPLI